jgi:glycosyltransferase involved in cell wall biosynthesis
MKERDRKRILFIEQNQDGTVGGSHYCLLYITQLIDKTKYEPLVMFYQENPLVQDFRNSGAEVIIQGKPRGKYLFSRFKKLGPLYFILKLIEKFYNITNKHIIPTIRFIAFLRKEKVDIVHLNNSVEFGFEWLIASKILGKPCLTFQRGYHDRLSMVNKFFGNRFDGIYCVSDVIRHNLLDNGIDPAKCFTLYDGIDPEKLIKKIKRSPLLVREEFHMSSTDLVIGMIGNFVPWKGQAILVRAMGLLSEKYPNLKCLLIGSSGTESKYNEYLHEIMDIVEEHKLHDKIIITGYRTDIADLLNTIDIQVHSPTSPDPFPHVILEGMTLGKAIVASNIGGAIESLEDGKSGFLVPPKNPSVLAESISKLISNAELRKTLGQNAMKRVQDKFHIKLNISNIQSIYDKLSAAH